MSGPLNHSPARIMQSVLVGKAIATLPATRLSWPIHNGYEPSEPDNCLTVFNTTGTDDGRVMFDGERQEHHGIQIRVRGTTEEVAYLKARAVAVLLDTNLYDYTVSIDSSSYLVHSASRTGDVISLGKEVPQAKGRHLFTINAIVALSML